MQREGISPIGAFFRNKWVWLVLALFLTITAVSVVFLVNNFGKTAAVNFLVTPIDAKISVNGSGEYNNEKTYYFAPGSYEVQISHDSLDTKTIIVDFKEDYNTTVAVFLSKEGNFDFYNSSDNADSYYVLVGIAEPGKNQTIDNDFSAEDFIRKTQKNYELFNEYLPIVDQTPTGYGLDYGVDYQYNTLTIKDGSYLEDCEKLLCLYVADTSGEKEQHAMDIIKKFGFDSDLCQIIYEKVDYE